MTLTNLRPVAANALDEALMGVRAGRRLVVRTVWRITIIDAKCLARFERAGHWLLKAEGEGYRLRSGKSSVYVLPGQLEQEMN